MSLYIHSDFIQFKKCMESLQNQTHLPDEVIIVCDGPLNFDVDNFINGLEIQNVKILKLDYNVGLGLALNIGLLAAKGYWIFRVDTDDLLNVNRFERQINHLVKNPDIDILGTQVNYIDINDRKMTYLRKVPLANNEIRRNFLLKNNLNHPTIAFKRSIVLEVGGYENLPFYEDWFLWLKLAQNKRIQFENISDFMVEYRVRNLNERNNWKTINNEFNFYKTVFKRKFGNYYFIPVILVFKIFVRLLPSNLYLLVKNLYNK